MLTWPNHQRAAGKRWLEQHQGGGAVRSDHAIDRGPPFAGIEKRAVRCLADLDRAERGVTIGADECSGDETRGGAWRNLA